MERIMNVCKIRKGGMFSTVQDLGRKGYYAEGIPISGAFDTMAYRFGNRIVGNAEQASGIEVLWGGLVLEFLSSTTIAVTGGDLGATIDAKPLPMWQKIEVKEGQKLAFSGRKTGLRAYVSFIGGLDVPLFLGSRSTYTILGKGGVEGRKLQADDILRNFADAPLIKPYQVPDAMRPLYTQPWKVRIVYGLQYTFFTEESVREFAAATWKVTHQLDRTGLRLRGPQLKFKDRSAMGRGLGGVDPSNIPTEGNPLGCIECPAGSELIVLGPDGPCEGGYAKLGTVITADFYLFGQMMGGDEVIFEPVSLAEAYEALYQQNSIVNHSK